MRYLKVKLNWLKLRGSNMSDWKRDTGIPAGTVLVTSTGMGTSAHSHSGYWATSTEAERNLSESMKKEIDMRVMRIIKLNTFPDEDIIKEIMKDPSAFELINAPSEEVKAAYKMTQL